VGLRDFPLPVDCPAVGQALRITSRRQAVSCRELGVELDGLVEQIERVVVAITGELMKGRHSTYEVVIGVETIGRLAFSAFDLGLLEFRSDRAHNTGGYLVLQVEDILKRPIKTIRP